MTDPRPNHLVTNLQSKVFISASKMKTEENLELQKNFNESILNSVSDNILIINPKNYRIIGANDAASLLLKLDKENLIGKTCYQATHHRSTPCTLPNDVCPMQEMLTTGKPVIVEHQHFDQENRRIDVEVSVHPVRDEDGEIVQVVHIDRDITKRKDQEREALSKAEEIRAIVDGIGDLLFVMDKNRILTKVNKATCDAFKKKPEEMIGKHCFEIVHGTNCPWPYCPATKTFKTKQVVTEEVYDPSLGVPLLVTTSPILNEQGEVVKVIHVAKDITKIKLAEMEMHISANLFEAASDSIMVHDLDGRIAYFNEAAYKTRGYTREEFEALKIQDLETQVNPEFFNSKMKELVEVGQANFEAYNLCKDKKVLPIEINARLIEFDNRKVILTVARDISERKKIEEEKNNLLKSLDERVKELNCVYGISKVFERSNISLEDALLEIVKLFSSAMQYPNITCARIIVENQEFTTKNFKDFAWKLQSDIKVAGKKLGFVEIAYLEEKPTVGEGPFLKEERNLLDAVAERLGKAVERIRAEEALNVSEQRWATTLSSIGDGIIASDVEGRITFINREAEKLTGWTTEETLKKPVKAVFKIINEQTRVEAEDPVAKVLESGLIVGLANNAALLRKDGYEIPIDDSASPIKDKNGNTTGVVIVFRDRTERKMAEEKLKESEEKYQITFEDSMDALMLLDEHGFLDCNKATLLLFGCISVKEFTEFHPADLSPLKQPDGLPSIEAATDHIDRAFKTGMDSFFWVHKRTDGSTFPADVLLTRITLKGRNVLQATVRNITEQKEAEEKLKEAEEKHRTLLNASNVLVQSVSNEGKFIFVNEEWKKVLGYTYEDLERINLKDVIRKDHLQYCMTLFSKVMDGSCVRDVETIFVTKDGKEIFVNGNACPVFKEGKVVSTVAFFLDITERKKYEEKLREGTRRIELMNEKLRVVGGLTRHDVRNKLAAVNGYAYLLKKKYADQPETLDRIGKIEQAVKESVKIFEFAKMYEQLGVEELTYVRLDEAVNEATALFSGLTFRISNECKGLSVLADSFLRQMFYNFIDNTRKYGKKTTEIRVYCRKAESGQLSLIYEDDGIGIDTENKTKLFSEGFSTGGSTGFGLFLTKKMIDVYGWEIQENGVYGKGAKFSITIPKVSKTGKENYLNQVT
jgi:PAS domain S-box-containing protein